MKIQEVIHLVEETLMEISKTGGQLSTGLTDKDFQELRDFLQLIHGHFSKHSVSISLREVNASLQLLRTKSAKDYVFGASDRIKASSARSADRGDVDKRSAEFAGPDRSRDVSEDRSEKTSMVAEVLEKMGYIAIDEENRRIRFTDPSGISRVRNFIQVTVDKAGINSPAVALQKFDKVKQTYQNYSRQNMSGQEPEFEGGDVVKEITPNILIFLSQVAKNNKRKQSWDSYLNPENYQNADSSVKGYFEYDPREAAESLVQMGLATKGDNGYLLNKEKIQQTVSAAQSRLSEIYKGAKLENPVHKTGGASKNEQQARQFINLMKKSFSEQVWQNAQKHVFATMREAGGSYENALEWYLGAKNSVSDEANQEQGVSAGHEKINKTYLGTIIDFVTAKYIAKKMSFDAAQVLGKNVKRPKSFITSRDLSPIASAYKTGSHKKPSRV